MLSLVAGLLILIKKEMFKPRYLVMEEKKNNIYTHCVFCGCAPKPDEWSSQVENACFDCV